MPYEFHGDPRHYHDMQHVNAREYVIPFVEKVLPLQPGMKVMEIGCAEAGVLRAFWDRGCDCTGIELNAGRIELAKTFMPEQMASGRMRLIAMNIFDVEFDAYKSRFDVVILKDVIEHVPDQKKLIGRLAEFLNEKGQIFFGFPPWTMPFGGHQQMARSKFLSRLPWFHLLPRSWWVGILRWGGEPPEGLQEMGEIWDCGISTRRFERFVEDNRLIITHRTYWFINPIYSYKFGLRPRVQNPLVVAIPFFRDFFTTAAFYLVGRK